jgi:hypothetical protein
MDMKMIVAVAVGICATRDDSWQDTSYSVLPSAQ